MLQWSDKGSNHRFGPSFFVDNQLGISQWGKLSKELRHLSILSEHASSHLCNVNNDKPFIH